MVPCSLDSSYCSCPSGSPNRLGSRGGAPRHAGTTSRVSVGSNAIPCPWSWPWGLYLGPAPAPQSRHQDLGTLGSQPGAGEQTLPVWVGMCTQVAEPRQVRQARSRGQNIITALRKPQEDSFRPRPLPPLSKARSHAGRWRGESLKVRNTPAQVQALWIGRARGRISSLMV